jgi:hypothetical protein
MKRLCFILITFFVIFDCSGQKAISNEEDSIVSNQNTKQYEVGYSFLTINSVNYILFSSPNELPTEFLNGVIFRYKKNRYSLRLNASFFLKDTRKEYSPQCVDCIYGDAQTKDYKIGAGFQYSLYKTKDIIYPYMDLNYKQRSETGVIARGLTGELSHFKNYMNGFNMVTGIGTKCKLYNKLYFSTEIGYNLYLAKRNSETVNILTNETSHSSSNYSMNNFLMKIYLSLVF